MQGLTEKAFYSQRTVQKDKVCQFQFVTQHTDGARNFYSPNSPKIHPSSSTYYRGGVIPIKSAYSLCEEIHVLRRSIHRASTKKLFVNVKFCMSTVKKYSSSNIYLSGEETNGAHFQYEILGFYEKEYLSGLHTTAYRVHFVNVNLRFGNFSRSTYLPYSFRFSTCVCVCVWEVNFHEIITPQIFIHYVDIWRNAGAFPKNKSAYLE